MDALILQYQGLSQKLWFPMKNQTSKAKTRNVFKLS